MNVLKPCPFCGGKANVSFDLRQIQAYAYCTQCKVSTEIYLTDYFIHDSPLYKSGLQQAIEAWNRRV